MKRDDLKEFIAISMRRVVGLEKASSRLLPPENVDVRKKHCCLIFNNNKVQERNNNKYLCTASVHRTYE